MRLELGEDVAEEEAPVPKKPRTPWGRALALDGRDTALIQMLFALVLVTGMLGAGLSLYSSVTSEDASETPGDGSDTAGGLSDIAGDFGDAALTLAGALIVAGILSQAINAGRRLTRQIEEDADFTEGQIVKLWDARATIKRAAVLTGLAPFGEDLWGATTAAGRATNRTI